MRTCIKCKKKKDIKQFIKNVKKKTFTRECKECIRKQCIINSDLCKRRYIVNNPEKIKAQRLARAAVKVDKLLAEPCKICGSLKVEMHHKDYTKPLDIVWLCREHHVIADKLRRTAEKFKI